MAIYPHRFAPMIGKLESFPGPLIKQSHNGGQQGQGHDQGNNPLENLFVLHHLSLFFVRIPTFQSATG
jgi:hypothetical protein